MDRPEAKQTSESAWRDHNIRSLPNSASANLLGFRINLETNRNMCGAGAILVVLSGVLFFGNLIMNWQPPRVGLTGSAPGGPTSAWFIGAGLAVFLCVTGIILLVIGLKGFADNYKDAVIFKNVVYALITAIIGAAAFFSHCYRH